MLPRTRYEYACLIVPGEGAAIAVVLDGQYQFHSLPTADNTAWKGAIIPNVAIELDHKSLFDAEGTYPPAGSMLRRGSELLLVARTERGLRTTAAINVLKDLPPSRDTLATGFLCWQIVLGEGLGKRILKVIAVKEKPTD
jgi:hypothetical protein